MAKGSKTELVVDRRDREDRRKNSKPVVQERRVKVQRRRQIDPTTCERDYSDDEIQFMHALDAYKRSSGRMFPTCSEILEVIRDMGYVKVTASPAAATETMEPAAEPTAATAAF